MGGCDLGRAVAPHQPPRESTRRGDGQTDGGRSGASSPMRAGTGGPSMGGATVFGPTTRKTWAPRTCSGSDAWGGPSPSSRRRLSPSALVDRALLKPRIYRASTWTL